jgi:hypothetical protein
MTKAYGKLGWGRRTNTTKKKREMPRRTSRKRRKLEDMEETKKVGQGRRRGRFKEAGAKSEKPSKKKETSKE